MAIEMTGASNALMVDDSEYDYKGAVKVNVDFVGVLYGFGFKLDASYPFKTVNTPMELLQIII